MLDIDPGTLPPLGVSGADGSLHANCGRDVRIRPRFSQIQSVFVFFLISSCSCLLIYTEDIRFVCVDIGICQCEETMTSA